MAFAFALRVGDRYVAPLASELDRGRDLPPAGTCSSAGASLRAAPAAGEQGVVNHLPNEFLDRLADLVPRRENVGIGVTGVRAQQSLAAARDSAGDRDCRQADGAGDV